MIRALFLAVLLLSSTATAELRITNHTKALDVDKVIRDPTQSKVDFPFATRSDEVLMAARLKLELGKTELTGVQGLEVLVNYERLALFSAEDLRSGEHERTIDIASRYMSDRNLLTFRLVTDAGGDCATVPAGTLKALLQSAELETEAGPLPLSNELANFPLPFVDRHHDRESTVPIVFASEPTIERIKLATLIASWLGMDSGLPMKFPVSVGALPDSRAIVLVDNADDATNLGVTVPDGPSVRMMDHPKYSGSNAKLLIIGGRDLSELDMAVRNLATGRAALAGEVVRFDKVPTVTPTRAYESPRWVPDGAIPFSKYPGKQELVHKGTHTGSISVNFRLAPDLWTWPSEFVQLDLRYEQLTPPGLKPARLDVEFNGVFVETLKPLKPSANGSQGQAMVRIRAEQLRGFNELKVHVTYPGVDACSGVTDDEARVTLLGESKLLLSGYSHFAALPNVAAFIHDGYPFTRVPDLGETTLVIPNTPTTSELSSALSMVAHLASITGVVGTRLTVQKADEFLGRHKVDQDVLLVGAPASHSVMRRWADQMPISLGSSFAQAQMPSQNNVLLRFLSGRLGHSELGRANDVIERNRSFTAVAAWESPLQSGRSVVAITGTSKDQLPTIRELSGFASARSRSGDLLVSAGAKRWMFRIGPAYETGKLEPWTQTRWALSTHWLVLFPAILIGAVVLGARVKRGLDQRIRERLSEGDK